MDGVNSTEQLISLVKKHHCIGLMSGTSMDGVDIAHVVFEPNGEHWNFEILHADCIPYSEQWYARLFQLPEQSAEVFAKTNVFYGKYLGQLVQQFITQNDLVGKIDLISSHGQTIFHHPQKQYTVQIGLGAEIAAATGIPTVCDLRTSDMAQGGQGAPIVPLGEKFLFPDYNCFINIGGISNISFHQQEQVIGYDVCMGNLLLDICAEQLGKPYDDGGEIAKSGALNTELLSILNQNPFFAQNHPKSLDAAEVIEQNLPLLEQSGLSLPDIMATLVEHIADQLAVEINQNDVSRVLVTGGGAFNHFMMERLQAKTAAGVVVPDSQVIAYKEALIMAFLGLKRLLKQVNVLSSVTGAKRDTINGAVYL